MTKHKDRKERLQRLIDKGLIDPKHQDQATDGLVDEIKELEEKLRKENAEMREQIEQVCLDILYHSEDLLKIIS